MELTANALQVLEARYLRRDHQGHVLESPEQLFARVARAVAQAELYYGPAQRARHYEELFLEALLRLDFLPNSPTLMNAGTPLGQLSACFVLPIEDSMVSIFDSLKLMALIQQSGGGTGFAFSRLRPEGDRVTSTGGLASGPVSFMRIFDAATENIKQGGKRRGANMGILRVDHPDIERFIHAKRDGVSFRNFNLSVGITDAFMQALERRTTFPLINPRTGALVRQVSAQALFDHICQAAWETGDPGLVFLDTINRTQPTPALGMIEATNPCGEVPLLPYEACNLASINLSHCVRQDSTGRNTVDWSKLATLVHLVTRFLDDVIDVCRWPDPRIASRVQGNRKIGLGVMGFAELLILLEVPYGSEQAVHLAEEIAAFLAEESLRASQQLAEERGVFPNWPQSRHAEQGLRLRNATRLSIAPTGTLSILAHTSASIEPLFALAYRRQGVLGGATLLEFNPLFLRYVREKGLYSPSLEQHLMQHGTLRGYTATGAPPLPESVYQLFRTALELTPQEHLRIQIAFQKYVDNAVSKTINLPHSATPQDIAEIYRTAYESGLKGITVFRYGSKGEQVLVLGATEQPHEREHFSRCDPEACRLT
ncbi:MAG: adenosylcobalamin-dependent ribonucleoside-diphosphate reductase [Gemmatales bacterium]|nr:adenosylcobalamin-dependent ribonucleoside-diphosphate reductase [Gemmatales bacterium]MDW7995941.1 adenosylcobalamin-dependent ribonucleoside-diphosphate reductase [Gemmatales bacterium]